MIGKHTRLINFYATGSFDRAALHRRNPAWLAERLDEDNTVLHVVWQGKTLIAEEEMVRLNLLRAKDHKSLIQNANIVVLLGIDAETAHVAVDLSQLDEPEIATFGRPTDLRSVGSLLPEKEASLAALAKGMAYWHSRHLHCGVCGHPTVSEQAGHLRRCTNPSCRIEHFPRTDPAVIMRITIGDRVLLGRQATWPPGMHSVLAGFVEPGESLEDAVRRETMEEVGLELTDVSYFASQPWPFPSSLMIGFTAEATSDQLLLDPDEIDSAQWLTRDQLLASPENEIFRLPRRDSIAWRLVADWIDRA